LESLESIQNRRKAIWNIYFEGLKDLTTKGFFTMLDIPEYATNNGHMFYLVCRNLDERTKLIAYLKEQGVGAVFHYLSLHLSDYYREHHQGTIPELPNCDRFADCLVRLPMFYELKDDEVKLVIDSIHEFYK
jgi:dTDP-4-amino-4,6-dideoxygalactose transaminase